MYCYWGFGLHILSEIEFPELLPFEFETPDVTIRLGKTPGTLMEEEVIHSVRASISPKEYLLKALNIANYYAANGNEIIVETLREGDEKSVRLFLLSNAFAAILHQRNTIPLHASGIIYNNGVVLFCGNARVGKSTISTAFQLMGYKLFSDDVCVLKQSNGETVNVYPSFPMVKLWQDSFTKIGLTVPDNALKIRPELSKYGKFYHDEFEISPQKVKAIFILDISNNYDEPAISKLDKMNAFIELQKNCYRPLQLESMKKKDILLPIASSLAATVPAFKVIRSTHFNSTQTLTKSIEQIIINL